jgi:hypothetical protein
MKFEIFVAIVMASASISAAPLADQALARRDTNIPATVNDVLGYKRDANIPAAVNDILGYKRDTNAANQALKYCPKKRAAEEKAAAEAKL